MAVWSQNKLLGVKMVEILRGYGSTVLQEIGAPEGPFSCQWRYLRLHPVISVFFLL